jgi:hypothetical protein
MGLVRQTALPPNSVVIGLEKAGVVGPQNQAHDRAALGHRDWTITFFCRYDMGQLSAPGQSEALHCRTG